MARWFRLRYIRVSGFPRAWLSTASHAPFPLPARQTGRARLRHPASRRDSPDGPRDHHGPFTAAARCFHEVRIVVGGSRQHGHSPDSCSLPRHSRRKVPSLHRHYSASQVLRTSPTSCTARPIPRGCPVASYAPAPPGSPVLRRSPCADMPSPLPRWDRRWDRVAPRKPTTAAFPHPDAGSAPTLAFSRPARRSHDITACLLAGPPNGPFHRRLQHARYRNALLRLLPAGATVAGEDLYLLRNRHLCPAHIRDWLRELEVPFPDFCYTVTPTRRFRQLYASWLRKTRTGTSSTRSQSRFFDTCLPMKVAVLVSHHFI